MSTPKFNERSKAIGDRIRACREAKKLSQNDLGKFIGRTRSAVAQWENGYAPPSIFDVEDMATVLGVSPAYLAYGVSPSMDDAMVIPMVEYQDERRTQQVAQIALDKPLMGRLVQVAPRSAIKAVVAPNPVGDVHKGDRLIIDDSVRSVNNPEEHEFFLLWNQRPMLAEIGPDLDPDMVSISISGSGSERTVIAKDKLHVLGRVVSRVTMVN